MSNGRKSNNWRRQLIEIAREFEYPKEVIEKLKAAKDEDAATVIMAHARRTILD